MTTSSIAFRPASAVGRGFYVGMAVLMAAVIVAGFSQTVPDDFTVAPYLPLLLHVHGAVFTCWVMLFIAQPAFVVRGSLDLHRRLGWVGAGLSVLMVIMGFAATLFALRHHRVPAILPPGIFLLINILGVTAFGGLVSAGIAFRHQSEWHKRLMLCAAVSIMAPGIGRLPMIQALGPIAPLALFGLNDLFALCGPAFDLVTRRRIHPAYGWGVAAIVLSQALTAALGFAPPTLAVVRLIRGH
jgi:hypothetical protein